MKCEVEEMANYVYRLSNDQNAVLNELMPMLKSYQNEILRPLLDEIFGIRETGMLEEVRQAVKEIKDKR